MPYVAPNTLNAIGPLLRGAFGMGGSFNQRPFLAAASQTIVPGDFLKFTGGAGVLTVEQLIAAPSVGSATNSGGTDAIVGIALDPITTNSSGVETSTGLTRQINVAVFDASLLFGLRVYNATASAAELQDLTIGTTYKLARYTIATGNSPYFLSTSSSGEAVYVENYLGSNPADDYGVAWCRANISETIQAD